MCVYCRSVTVSEVAAFSQLLHSPPTKEQQNTDISIYAYVCVRLPVSEVAATSAAASRPTASHPRSAICVHDSSRRARVTGASALHIECMQMLQIIVFEDPLPTRLLLTHHSTRIAVPAWRYDSSCQAFSEASPAAGNLGVIAIPQIPPSP
jgi:hypothetical protein